VRINRSLRCRKKFLQFFPKGFTDETYIAWERDYKWQAHVQFEEKLNKDKFYKLLTEKIYHEIARKTITIESKTNLLFSFEKMALRDGVKGTGSKLFAEGLYSFIYGNESMQIRFEKFSEVLSKLPRKQTRVLTWPLMTVFGFIAKPLEFIFLKPRVTQRAATEYGFDFIYESKPNWKTYQSLLDFAKQIRKDISDLKPRDMIDIQSFIWVMGSEEYD
jgi:hypothetical protein